MAAMTPSPSPSPFAGRIALVTGASSGIGAAIARSLADGGATVAGLARRADRVAELGAGVTPIAADVTDPVELAAAVDRVVAELGVPDLVVANAGVAHGSPLDDIRLDDWQHQIDVNVSGVVATVAATVPHLVAAAAEGRPADLVVISSVVDALSFPAFALYGASKAAVSKLTHGLRLDLAPQGVRTLNVRPGAVETEILDGVAEDLAAGFKEIPALEPRDIAGAVLAALALPAHVNVSELTIVPTGQPAAL
jgi:NADP-dependent 3-hydroxy acid dehydrogenase YdfG